MNDKFFTKDIDRHRTLVVDKQTGKEHLIVKDQKYREMVARGDFLQPVGQDKQKFLDKNPQYKFNSKNELVNVELQKTKTKEQEESLMRETEQEDFKNRRLGFDKKYY